MKADRNEVVDCEYNFLEIFIMKELQLKMINNSDGIGNDDGGSVAILAIAVGSSLQFSIFTALALTQCEILKFSCQKQQRKLWCNQHQQNQQQQKSKDNDVIGCFYCLFMLISLYPYHRHRFRRQYHYHILPASPSAVVVIIIEFRNHLCAMHIHVSAIAYHSHIYNILAMLLHST